MSDCSKHKREKLFSEKFDIAKRYEEIQKENRFWHQLEDIGFKVKRFSIGTMHHIQHEVLPISSSFEMDAIKMVITKMTIETAHWLYPKNTNEYVMTCENFIAYHIKKARTMLQDISSKLDNRTFI